MSRDSWIRRGQGRSIEESWSKSSNVPPLMYWERQEGVYGKGHQVYKWVSHYPYLSEWMQLPFMYTSPNIATNNKYYIESMIKLYVSQKS